MRLIILPLDRSHREHSIPLIGSFIIYPPQVGIVMLGGVITAVGDDGGVVVVVIPKKLLEVSMCY